jgi:hypothetical protein
MPILDDTVTDYAGNKMAFALSTRNSVGQFGMIITILASPMVYNIRGSFVDCGWFMLGFISFGFAITMIVVALDTEGKQKVPRPSGGVEQKRPRQVLRHQEHPEHSHLRHHLGHHQHRPGSGGLELHDIIRRNDDLVLESDRQHLLRKASKP